MKRCTLAGLDIKLTLAFQNAFISDESKTQRFIKFQSENFVQTIVLAIFNSIKYDENTSTICPVSKRR